MFQGNKRQALFLVKTLRYDLGTKLRYVNKMLTLPQGANAPQKFMEVYSKLQMSCASQPEDVELTHSPSGIVSQALDLKRMFPNKLEASVVTFMAMHSLPPQESELHRQLNVANNVWKSLNLNHPLTWELLHNIATRYGVYGGVKDD